jgi:DNA-binding MurR/RpiR family transcriptional regulator
MKRSDKDREPFAHERGFRARILAAYENLSPQQRQVADYVLEHLREVAFSSVPELAVEAGTSEATIVRFAQSVGYDGFSAFKTDLATAMREEVSAGAPRPLRKTPDADPLSAVAALEIENIQRSIDALDRKLVRQVAERLYAVDHVFAFGIGISGNLAELFVYLLGQIGVRATAISNRLTSPREALATMTKRDLLAVFSFPPYSPPTLELLRDANRLHVPVLAFSDKATAPAARLADFALCARSDNLMYTNAIAAITVLLDGLVTSTAMLHEERASRAVAHINALADTDD